MAVAQLAEKPIPATPVRHKRLDANTLVEAQFCRQFLFAKVAPGVTQDDCRSPHFLALVGPQLRRHAIISLLADDESWELELCVERVLRDEVHVSARKVYAREALSKASTPVDDNGEFRCEYRGAEGFCVVRNVDDQPVERGHTQASSAIAAWRNKQPRRVLS